MLIGKGVLMKETGNGKVADCDENKRWSIVKILLPNHCFIDLFWWSAGGVDNGVTTEVGRQV